MREVHWCVCLHERAVHHKDGFGNLPCNVKWPEVCPCGDFEYAMTHPDDHQELVESLGLPAAFGVSE